MSPSLPSFSEREFYLAEFRGRTLGIAWPSDETPAAEPLVEVVRALVANGSRVVLFASDPALFDVAGVEARVSADAPAFAPALWRGLRDAGCAGLCVPAEGFEGACRDLALVLRLAKVVFIRSAAPVERAAAGPRASVVDLAHLRPLLDGEVALPGQSPLHRAAEGADPLLRAIRGMIEGGIPSVNVCAPADLARELFTYAGAGIFFTRDRYADVRPLSLDDYDLANDLMVRGEADGFLAPRDAAARDAVLAHGVGVFIEGRYLAGIGAILPHPEANAAEIASLFALTRYAGEGAGAQIVRFAIARAREAGLAYLFSCTTSERVEGFFERLGFARVEPESLPPGKWKDYDEARRVRVRCLRIDLTSE